MNEPGRPARPARGIGDPLLAFSRGEIGRRRAMGALGIGYGESLDRLAERRLPLPQLPEAELDRMVAVMLDVSGRTGRRAAGVSR